MMVFDGLIVQERSALTSGRFRIEMICAHTGECTKIWGGQISYNSPNFGK